MNPEAILLLNILKHAYLNSMAICIVPANRFCLDILFILTKLNKIKVIKHFYKRKGQRVCRVAIYYNSLGYSLMHNLQLVSTATRPKFVSVKQLYERYPLYSTLVCTSHGILLAVHAVKLSAGGIVLCTWND